jgi:uncharacterized protein
LIILELQKARFNNGQRSNLFYWRDRTGNEIDVLLDQSSQVVPIEIKTATTFTSDYLKGINYWRKINPQTKNSYVIFTGKSSGIDKTELLNWKQISLIKN